VPPGSVLRARPLAAAPVGAAVFVVPPGPPGAEVTADPDGTTTLEGLAAGAWGITLEKGDWFRVPIRFGGASTTVAPATHATVTLVVAVEPSAPPTIEVGGTLFLPPAWGSDVTLVFEPGRMLGAWSADTLRRPLDGLQNVAAGEFRWPSLRVFTGKYMLHVEGTGFRTVLDVRPETRHVTIVVPEPATVTVRTVDAESGAPIPWPEGAAPGWYANAEGWDAGWTHGEVVADGPGVFTFRAPLGKVTIDAHPEGYAWVRRVEEVRAGQNTFELRLARVSGVEIELRDGATVLPWPAGCTPQLKHVGTGRGPAYWSGNKVAAEQAGEHELTLDSPDGYAPIAPQRVTIPAGQWVKVVVPLVRRQ
jgi:hypothetical protein